MYQKPQHSSAHLQSSPPTEGVPDRGSPCRLRIRCIIVPHTQEKLKCRKKTHQQNQYSTRTTGLKLRFRRGRGGNRHRIFHCGHLKFFHSPSFIPRPNLFLLYNKRRLGEIERIILCYKFHIELIKSYDGYRFMP